jgi:hypothetical protein
MQAGWLSRVTFYWVTTVVYVGYQRQLKPSDLPEMDEEYVAQSEVKRFWELWKVVEEENRAIAEKQGAEPQSPTVGRVLWRQYRR